MKKQIIILILLFFNCFLAWSQGRFVKTTTPCNNELLKKTPGRLLKAYENFNAKISNQQKQEILVRLNIFNKFMFDLYRSPVAFDASSTLFINDRLYGYQLKFERYQNGINSYEVNGIPVVQYSYTAFFCPYNCGRDSYEIMRGQGCEAGTNMRIEVNSFDGFLKRTNLGGEWEEIMCVDRRPIKMMPVIIGRWKGYDQYAPQSGSGTRLVLLHREGELPYIPVTRKQYLERSFACVQKFFTEEQKSIDNLQGLALLADKKDLEEMRKKHQKFKDDVFKYYQDELEATTKAGLLNSPAVIFGSWVNMLTQYPLFQTEAAGGIPLVTENPAYMKKELPKYIPQFMVYSMWDCQCGPDPSLNPYKLINEMFPIEKLQVMIDK